MTAVIYARYSAGSKQTEQSIEGQLRVCRAFCKEKDLTVVGEYCDRHISGRTDERPQFQNLIADAKKKRFDAVVVYKTDRFARNKYDSAIYKRELRKAGVRIYYAAEAIPEGPEGIILESLMEGLAEYYSEELAQKIKRGMHENALKCKTTGPDRPLGYTIDREKHFVVDLEAAQRVRTIFELYNKGLSTGAICEHLNASGIRTKRGNLFRPAGIMQILKNRKYIGEYSYDGVVVPDGIPAIISREEFAMAQAEIERRKRTRKPKSPKGEYLLAGKLFCGECGAPMVGVSGTGKTGKVWYYYYCQGHRKKVCPKKQVSREWLEALVADLTIQYVLKEDVLVEIASKVYQVQQEEDDTSAEIQAYKKRLADNKKARDNIMRAIETGVETESLPARLKELEQERLVLEGDLARLMVKRPDFTEDQILFMLRRYAKPKDGEDDAAFRKRVISCFVSEVRLWDDKILIVFNITDPDGRLRSIGPEVFDQALNWSTKAVAGRTHTIVTVGAIVLVSRL